MNTKIKSGFYKGYLESQKKPDSEEAKPKEQIVIVNKRERDGLLKVLLTAIGAILRFIIYAVLFALSSVGLTALLNEETRSLIFEIISIG